MSEDKFESLNSEQPIRVESLVKQPMKISSEAFELLRRASIPSEFLNTMRDFTPDAKSLPQTIPERLSTPAEIMKPVGEISYQSEWEEFVSPDEPTEPELEMPDSVEAPVEIIEGEPKDSSAGMFMLTDLMLDMSGIAHMTAGLYEWEGITLGRIVTNTYPVLFQNEEEEFLEEEGDGEGEPTSTACTDCKMILVFGPSQKFNGTANKFEISDEAIQEAHEAAAVYYDAHKRECLRVIHAGWRTGNYDSGLAYRYSGEKGGWEKTSSTSKVEKWVNAKDSNGNPIDCFSHVLVIYHGESRQKTVDVLKWLAKYCQAPIRHLYLWSCWGSEKIDLKNSDVKNSVKKVQELRNKRAQNIEKEKQKLEKRVNKLEKEVDRLMKGSKRNKPSTIKKKNDLERGKAQLKRLKERLRCDCQLCLYTSAPLDVNEAKKRLDEKIEDANTPKDELKRAKRARAKLVKGKKDQYAVPLGIKPVKADNKKMVLLAPERKMLVYCPLDSDNPKSEEKSIDGIEFFPDVPVEQEENLTIRSLLKKGL